MPQQRFPIKRAKMAVNLKTRLTESIVDAITPMQAYAIGRSESYLRSDEAVARMLVTEGLARVGSDGKYIYAEPIAEMVSKAFDAEIGRAYPEPQPEPDVELIDEDPVEPGVQAIDTMSQSTVAITTPPSVCPDCGRPGGRCSDHRVDVKPPGVED